MNALKIYLQTALGFTCVMFSIIGPACVAAYVADRNRAGIERRRYARIIQNIRQLERINALAPRNKKENE